MASETTIFVMFQKCLNKLCFLFVMAKKHHCLPKWADFNSEYE